MAIRPIFLSQDARVRPRWAAAFPDLVAARLDSPPGDLAQSAKPVVLPLLWVLRPPGEPVAALVKRLRASTTGVALVILADDPSEDDAMAALGAGAAGYCNGHAAPAVLNQIAMVVENGGIWVGQNLMQRLLTATARLSGEGGAGSATEGADEAWRSRLTPREQETAELLAKGASNKEIARQLAITERTVKAHVGAMLEKLGARDRLQLSLIINGIEKARVPGQ